ncbi:hypothetical protein FRC16_011434 [Serendipita sp. 398]|nr:hypothetical protein FRC16_011434 [Serendipita sp. 398]
MSISVTRLQINLIEAARPLLTIEVSATGPSILVGPSAAAPSSQLTRPQSGHHMPNPSSRVELRTFTDAFTGMVYTPSSLSLPITTGSQP